MVRVPEFEQVRSPSRLEIVGREGLAQIPRWQMAFASERKDHRYYELVEDTLHPEFEYRYFLIRDTDGQVCAVQPFFLLDQVLLVGMSHRLGPLFEDIRRTCRRFMRARMLLVGGLPGDGRLAGP